MNARRIYNIQTISPNKELAYKTGCNIIDPYMGSGTLAVVCKLLGHNYFGIDISEEYITNANNRVNNISEKEITDFNTEIQKHKVNKTYKERKLEKGK